MTTPTTHALKTVPWAFQAILDGLKTFEIRKNDRDFQVDDVLELKEYSEDGQCYTGRKTFVKVIWIMSGGFYGLASDHVCMSIVPTRQPQGKPTGFYE